MRHGFGRVRSNLVETARETVRLANALLDETDRPYELQYLRLRADVTDLSALLAEATKAGPADAVHSSVALSCRTSEILTDLALLLESPHSFDGKARPDPPRAA